MNATTLRRPAPAKSLAVYRWIYAHARDRGYQPSLREVTAHFDFASLFAAVCHLRVLAARGYIAEPEAHRARALRFLRRPDGEIFTGFADRELADAPTPD